MILFNDTPNQNEQITSKDNLHHFLFKGTLSFDIIEVEASSLNTTFSNIDQSNQTNLKKSISTESFNYYDIKQSIISHNLEKTEKSNQRRSMRSRKETKSLPEKSFKYKNLLPFPNVSFTLSYNKQLSSSQRRIFSSSTSNNKQKQSKSTIKHNTFKTITGKTMFNNGRWTFEEHKRFVYAILNYGNEWKTVQNEIKSRTSTQSRSHSQKFFLKIRNVNLNSINIVLTNEEIEKGVEIVYDSLNISNLKELYDKLSKDNKKSLLNYLLNIESGEDENEEKDYIDFDYSNQDLKKENFTEDPSLKSNPNRQITFGTVSHVSQLNNKRKISKESKEIKENTEKDRNKKEKLYKKEEKPDSSMDLMNINRRYSLRKESDLFNLKPNYLAETDISYKDSVSNKFFTNNQDNRKETIVPDEFSSQFNETFLNSRHRRKTSYYDDAMMLLYSNNLTNGKKVSMNGMRKSSTQTSQQENFKVDSFFNDFYMM